MINDYLSLSTRSGFNKSLSHFRMVTDIVKRLGQRENLANIVDALEKGKGVEKSQIGPILNAVVIDRLGYASRSFNLTQDLSGFDALQGEVNLWNRIDLLIAYHHPQLGISLINPKDKSHWETIREIDRDELVVLYVRSFEEQDNGLVGEALTGLYDLLHGRKVNGAATFGGARSVAPPKPPPAAPAPTPSAPAATTRLAPPAGAPAPPPPPSSPGPAVAKTEEPAPAPAKASGGKVRMTPKYSVQVSNELFHNGNVEAWKNIVESYKTKFAGMEVHIFHDGQKVNNINALFKWGKVKHGDVILFCVSGEEIKGVAKLQRYLYEGASLRFEHYLKKDVNKVLNLF